MDAGDPDVMIDASSHKFRSGWPWGWLFFAFVLALYLLLLSLKPEVAGKALSSYITQVVRILPAISIVFILLVLFHVFVDPKQVGHYVGKKSGLTGWMVALIAGIISVGPIYPWYVLLSELKQKGMSPSLIAVLLYSRAVKPPLIPLMIHYFGFVFTSVLMAYIVALAVLNGIAIKYLFREPDSDSDSHFDLPAR
jgi:uncharacterized membrane protein YraQ (UPF0718 family)